MTGVADIVKQKAFNDFERWLFKLAVPRGANNRNALAALFYGRNEKGKAKNTSTVYNILCGKQSMTRKTAELWGAALGAAPTAILKRVPGIDDKPAPLSTEVTRHVVLEPMAPKPRPAAGNDQFALVVDQDGTATIRLNLVGVPMSKALRIMGALTSAGLLGATEE